MDDARAVSFSQSVSDLYGVLQDLRRAHPLSSPCQNTHFRRWLNFDELERSFVSG